MREGRRSVWCLRHRLAGRVWGRPHAPAPHPSVATTLWSLSLSRARRPVGVAPDLRWGEDGDGGGRVHALCWCLGVCSQSVRMGWFTGDDASGRWRTPPRAAPTRRRTRALPTLTTRRTSHLPTTTSLRVSPGTETHAPCHHPYQIQPRTLVGRPPSQHCTAPRLGHGAAQEAPTPAHTHRGPRLRQPSARVSGALHTNPGTGHASQRRVHTLLPPQRGSCHRMPHASHHGVRATA